MTLDELIEKLTELRDEGGVDGEALVMMAHQPNYPLQTGVTGPVVFDEKAQEAEEIESRLESCPEDFEDEEDREDARQRMADLRANPRPIVYILEGANYPHYKGEEVGCYASRDLWDLR